MSGRIDSLLARVSGAELFLIKPPSLDYDQLTADSMVLCTLDGEVVPDSVGSERRGSSDTAAHAYVYRHMSDARGVVRTHSTYACAWAARGEAILCALTGMADEFGGEIPVGPIPQSSIDSLFDKYQNVYGQAPQGALETSPASRGREGAPQ